MTDAPVTRPPRRNRQSGAAVPPNEAERLAALKQYLILDTGPERAFDELAELAAHLAGCPMAYVSIIDATRQWLKSAHGFDAEALECPREVAICADTILGSDLLIISDLAAHPRYRDYPIVRNEPYLRFYCGAPLVTAEGYALGSLCVIDTVPHTLDEAQQERIRRVARQVVSELELRRKIVELDASLHHTQVAEEALRVAHEQLDLDHHGVLDSMTDGVISLTPDGRISVINATGAAILAEDPNALIGTMLSDLAVENSASSEFVEATLAALTDSAACERRTVDYRGGGEARRLSVASAAYRLRFGPQAGRTGIVTVFTDVTEMERLRESEAAQHGKLQTAYRDLEASAVHLQQANRRIQLIRLAATVGFVALFAAVAAYVWMRSGDIGPVTAANTIQPGQQTIVAQPHPIKLQIATVGTIEAGSIVNLVGPFEGQVKEKLFDYGGAVKRDQKLVVMDTSDLESRLGDAQTALIKARQRMSELQNWSGGIDMSRARRSVATAQQGVDSLKAKIKETKMLLDKGIVSRGEYTDLQEQMQSHQFQLDDARQDFASAQARGDAETQRIAGFELARAETKAKELEGDLSKAVIAAPVSGVVLQPPEDSGTGRRVERVEVGAHVTKGQTMVSIGNLESFTVKASIDEIDINKLRVGQSVTVTGDAFEGMVLSGTVTSVAAQAGKDPSGGGAMAVFPITIAVAAPSEQQRRVVHVGMSATLSIVTYDKPEAIVLPPAAIHLQGDGATVALRAPGSAEIRTVPVKLGVTTSEGIEIREGVAAGDTIVIGG